MARRDYVPAVTAVVVQNGRILLEHRVDNDLWALPGGALAPGETASEAAVREVRQQFSIFLRADPVGGELEAQRSEAKRVAWKAGDPAPRGVGQQVVPSSGTVRSTR